MNEANRDLTILQEADKHMSASCDEPTNYDKAHAIAEKIGEVKNVNTAYGMFCVLREVIGEEEMFELMKDSLDLYDEKLENMFQEVAGGEVA